MTFAHEIIDKTLKITPKEDFLILCVFGVDSIIAQSEREAQELINKQNE